MGGDRDHAHQQLSYFGRTRAECRSGSAGCGGKRRLPPGQRGEGRTQADRLRTPEAVSTIAVNEWISDRAIRGASATRGPGARRPQATSEAMAALSVVAQEIKQAGGPDRPARRRPETGAQPDSQVFDFSVIPKPKYSAAIRNDHLLVTENLSRLRRSASATGECRARPPACVLHTGLSAPRTGVSTARLTVESAGGTVARPSWSRLGSGGRALCGDRRPFTGWSRGG